MYKYLLILTINILFLLNYIPVSAQQLAFPEAEGFGRFATGGRNGTSGFVCHVTSLTDTNSQSTGVGSQISGTPHHSGDLRYCATLSGARTIIFDISGTIALQDRVTFSNPNVTIAGHTAPVSGVQIRDEPTFIAAENFIVRHMRYRPGKLATDGSAVSDGLTIVGSNVHDVMMDHVSVSWAVDENGSIYTGATNITMQWCIISEPLHCAGHAEGCHGKGWLVGGGGSATMSITLHHNLFALADDRVPWFKKGQIDFVNNVVYSPGNNGNLFSATDYEIRANVVSNYYKNGLLNPSGKILLIGVSSNASWFSNSGIFLDGNISPLHRSTDTGAENSLVRYTGTPPYLTEVGSRYSAYPMVNTTDAFTAFDAVKLDAGATKPIRDAVDASVISAIDAGTGVRINSVSASLSGGYPNFTVESRSGSYDSDSDGIRDSWETLCNGSFSGSTTGGLSSSDTLDSREILDWSSPTSEQALLEGYSKLEIYLNELAGDYPVDSCGGLESGGEEDTTDPSIPSNVSAIVINNQQIDVSWDASTDASGISGYRVAYCQDDGSETCTPSTTVNIGSVTNYIHSGLLSDTTYGYQVLAIDGSANLNESAYSSPVVYATTERDPDITTGLVSHWQLNNDLSDSGSASANGSFVGGTPSFMTGRVGGSIDLNGSSQYVTVTDNAAHDFGTATDFSFAFWVKKDTNTTSYIISKAQAQGGSSDGGWGAEWSSSDNELWIHATSDAWNNYCTVASAINIADGEWHHIAANVIRAASCTIAQIEIFVDGAIDSNRSTAFTSANTNANISNDDPLWIGAEHVSGSPAKMHDGGVDDVRVYNRLLLGQDVISLYALGAIDFFEFPLPPVSLSTSASAAASLPDIPDTLSTSTASSPEMPGNPDTLSDSALDNPAFPGLPTGVSGL